MALVVEDTAGLVALVDLVASVDHGDAVDRAMEVITMALPMATMTTALMMDLMVVPMAGVMAVLIMVLEASAVAADGVHGVVGACLVEALIPPS